MSGPDETRSDPPQIQVVPETSSDERMHVLSAECWCHPLNEFVPNPQTGRNDWVIRHRDSTGAFA